MASVNSLNRMRHPWVAGDELIRSGFDSRLHCREADTSFTNAQRNWAGSSMLLESVPAFHYHQHHIPPGENKGLERADRPPGRCLLGHLTFV
jgi:hypothetical protein